MAKVGRRGNGSSSYHDQKWFVDGIRLHKLIIEHQDKSCSSLCKEHGLSNAMIVTKFETIKDENNRIIGIQLDKYISSKQGNIKHYREIDQELLKIINNIMDDGKSNQYIFENINYELMRRDLKMENGKLVNVEKRNEVVNVAVDLGNKNVKGAIGDKTFIFSNKVGKEYQAYDCADNDYIKMDNENYYNVIGRDTDKIEFDEYKTEKNFMPTLLYSISKALVEAGIEADDVTVNIALLLPISQMDKAESYKEKVREFNGEAGNLIEVRIGSETRMLNIKIDNIEIFAEGVASYPESPDMKTTQLIADVGSRTTNLILIRNFKKQEVKTLEIGSFDYYNTLIKKSSNQAVNLSNIAELIEDGVIDNDVKEMQNHLKKILGEAKKLISYPVKKIYLTGGFIQSIKDEGISIKTETIEFFESPLFSNVIGAGKLLTKKMAK